MRADWVWQGEMGDTHVACIVDMSQRRMRHVTVLWCLAVEAERCEVDGQREFDSASCIRNESVQRQQQQLLSCLPAHHRG